MLLYFLIRFLKKGLLFGTSTSYFQLKRLNKLTFTGGLFALYLTGSSLIAMLFLLTHVNTESVFWWFQVSFYFIIFVTACVLIIRRARIQGIRMANPFIEKLKSLLVHRKKELVEDTKDLQQKDPFIREANEPEGRDNDEIGDEMQEQMEHFDVAAVKADVADEIAEIDESLDAMKKGKYGICQNCGKPISKERLKAYPTAKYCMDCAPKFGE
jgi:DnaK suppressor protein